MSASTWSTMPFTRACSRRSSTVPERQASSATRAPASLAHPLGQLDQAVGGVGAPVEEDVLDRLQQLLVDLLVHGELAGVDDPHVHAGADGVEAGTTLCIASRTTSLPRNENERLLTPPLILAPGQRSLIRRVASMKAIA